MSGLRVRSSHSSAAPPLDDWVAFQALVVGVDRRRGLR
jgi:hypothetical protein